ncbi:hypothetical protein ZOSMA_14G00820 [Zostera marina]|uniref:Uncharacterized protein n=1 Tax=Zostera marina TaxID=29655 RepID=A0A0K9PYL0_ZOSMR|nr:hypothetical protein ZOSMA_14G00820 [Zostera marina]
MATQNPARPPKRKRFESSGRGGGGNYPDSSSVSPLAGAQFSIPNLKIQQAKNFSVMQAQQDGCLASYKTFDSHFGNYLLPVIPSYADLFSENIASKSNHSLPKQ